MKIKSFLNSFLMSFLALFLFIPNIYSSIQEMGFVSIEKSLDDFYGTEPAQELLKEKQELEEQNVRSINIVSPGAVTFNRSAFYGANYFYLGANSDDATASALMRAYITVDQTTQKNKLALQEMAPSQVYLNGATEDGKPVKTINPIYSNKISYMSLMGRYPAVVLGIEKTIETVDFAANQLVALVDDPDSGTSVKTITEKLQDAAGAESSGVVGLSASQSNIFAAVKPNVGNFGVLNSAFSMLAQQAKGEGLEFKNQVKLDLTKDVLCAINQDATVGGFGDMYWDTSLQRLFIGLNRVERTANDGGVVSLLVGRIENGELKIESSVGLYGSYFDVDQNYHVVGFYNNSGAVGSRAASILKVRTMHTSTGKDYVIVSSSIKDPVAGANLKIQALPIVSSQTSSGTDIAVGKVGKIAQKNDFEEVIDAAEQLLKVENTIANKVDYNIATVGAGDFSVNSLSDIDMFVEGDSVFLCVSEAAVNTRGIFRSTALFGSDGKIRAWTAWQRVMGAADKVYGAGLDVAGGNYWYLTNVGTDVNTVKATQWGKSVAETGMLGNGLVDLLSTEFTQANAGVHQTFNFDEQTPGFDTGKFSMMVATGFQKVALIQTGAGDPFTPTAEFIKDTNVFINSDSALEAVGPICCSDVSRIAKDNMGWLFVAGDGGVAVLRQANGFGWNGATGLSELSDTGFPGVAGWTFKLLTIAGESAFSQVRKIVCDGDGEFLYVATADKLYRVKMQVANFIDGANIAAASLQEISITDYGTPLDMLVYARNNTAGNTRLLLSTTKGLFYSNNIADTAVGIITTVWTSVKVDIDLDVNLPAPVSHLEFLSKTKGGTTTDGNLYALVNDFAYNLATLYRFNVADGVITHITEPSGTYSYYAIGNLRSDFKTDGALGYHMLSKHLGNTNFLKKIKMLSSQTSIRNSEVAVNLDVDSSAYNIGVMTQNTASGAWVVPGDWGIRVNE